jgi:hypothetical protein
MRWHPAGLELEHRKASGFPDAETSIMLIVILDVGVEEVASTGVDVGKVLVEPNRDETIIAVQKADMRDLWIRQSSCERLVQRRVETCARLR